ncbi:MAG: hypothetical protein OHK0029_34940 [Armatimonadaceae bacterium]
MTKGKVASLIVGILLAVPATTAFAQTEGFESGTLGSFTGIGNASASMGFDDGTTVINPLAGSFMAQVSTQSAVTDSSLETFLGLSSGKLDSLSPQDVFVGSAIKRTVTVNAGDQVVFSYNFQSYEYNPFFPPFANDFSFFSVAETNNADAFVMVTDLSAPSSGWIEKSYTFANAGTFTIGLGAVNTRDTLVASNLFVDNFQVVSGNGGVNPVPEPGEVTTALFLGATLLGGIVIGRRRRQNAA